MPRVGDVFQLLSGTLAVPNTTIQSAPYNAQQNDWVTEANSPRPISAGGTGETTAEAARISLGAIGSADLASADTKATVVNTDSVVIIDSEDDNTNKRWLMSDIRTAFSIMTDLNPQFVSTDAGAEVGPILFLDRLSASPADNDLGGTIQFRGKTSEDTTITYADMYLKMDDISVDTVSGSPVPTTDGSLIFRTQRAGTLTTALTLGTATTISGALTVTGATTISGALTAGSIATTGTITTDTYLYSSTASLILRAQSNGVIHFRPNGGSGTNESWIEPSGNWMIEGTSVDINGGYDDGGDSYGISFNTYWMRQSTTGSGSVTVQGYYNNNGRVGSISTNGSSTGFNTSSDENLKDFIGPYDPLEAIRIIRADPVRDFTWKADGAYAVGWGAQTSHAISPDLAAPPAPNEPNAPWGIDQGKRTPYLWAALTWALDRIDELHDRVKVLEEEPA